jgi:TolA-binding protein
MPDTTSDVKSSSSNVDLLPNEREVSYEGLPRVWNQNKSLIIGSAVLLILAAAGFATWQFQEAKTLEQANASFAAARTPEALQRVAQDFEGTTPALLAAIKLADMYFQESQWDKAGDLYRITAEKYPSSPLKPSALIGQAAVLEAKGKVPEAIAQYQSVAKSYPNSFQAPQALFAAGRLLESSGKLKESRQTFDELLMSHSDSAWREEATVRIQKIDAMLKK